jgi:predicted Zn finger-like uncharacterized protein
VTMTTRCPHCGTTFKVVPDQLRVRNGLVRCGECSAVFDGRASLVAQAPQVPERPSSVPVPEVPAAPAVLRSRADISKVTPPADEPDEESFEDEEVDSRLEPDHLSSVVVGESRPHYYGTPHPGRAAPEFLDTGRQAHRAFLRSLWGYACVVGLIVLAAQLVYVYRSNIAEMAPKLRPALERLCKPLGCEVGYMRHLDKILITSSTLRPPVGQASLFEQAGSGTLILRASLRNTYQQPQPWPALRLDLRDLSDTVVMRKVLLPEAYLPKALLQKPFGAGAEFNIELPIKVEGVSVNGFDLHQFFP